ncbi:hypothetical protein NW768_003505 [Fusarium equiseti]|uniref:Uncharacterized protein n=1 Tax=Fusarium equiseti TaxID=61235 RepID=A0ABQ8RHU9_FUSEQ|nr:hypothetical protein NW768_003505 [Fusarium equiseti]
MDSQMSQILLETPRVETVQFRSAWPCLCPLPLELYDDNEFPDWLLEINSEIYHEFNRSVSRHRITYRARHFDWHLGYSSLPSDPHTNIPTLLIVGSWNMDSKWEWPLIVQDMATCLNSYLEENQKARLEMRARYLHQTVYIFPPPANMHLEQDWPRIRDCVYECLQAHEATRSHTTAITLMKRGYSQNPRPNPITIYISLDLESNEEEWEDVVKDIKACLKEIEWGNLFVHMEHGLCKSYMLRKTPPMGLEGLTKTVGERAHYNRQEYRVRMRPEDDIAATRCSWDGVPAACATMGCWIEFQQRSDPDKWHKGALTNYQVARPAFKGYNVCLDTTSGRYGDGRTLTKAQYERIKIYLREVPATWDSHLEEVDELGFQFRYRDKRSALMESPSRLKHNFYMKCLEEDRTAHKRDLLLEPLELANLLEDIDEKRTRKAEFFEMHLSEVHRVLCCSGNRIGRDRNALDWAVLGMGARNGQNILLPGVLPPGPPSFLICQCGKGSSCFVANGVKLKNSGPGLTMRSMEQGTQLWKGGSSTGITQGTFSRYRSLCRAEGRMSLEWPIFGGAICSVGGGGPDESFAAGDGGAAVFDSEGRVVGLLTRGQRAWKDDKGYGFVTPIEDVFADIIDSTEGDIKAVRIAED